VKLPTKGWIIAGNECHCDETYRPHELFYLDLDWACTDAKKINEDHPGHRVVEVKITRANEKIL
jgi:hypothetical protein